MYEYPLNIPEDQRPTCAELQQHSEANIVKRGIARLLIPRNPERSIRLHTWLGAPVMRAVIMGTYGRFIPRSAASNYRTDPSKSRIEGATRFAVGGSVFNEVYHAAVAALNLPVAVTDLAHGHVSIGTTVIGVGLNASLVSLQRYNRARMVQRINEELEAGNGYEPGYTNWLGIDARAVDNYADALPQRPMPLESNT